MLFKLSLYLVSFLSYSSPQYYHHAYIYIYISDHKIMKTWGSRKLTSRCSSDLKFGILLIWPPSPSQIKLQVPNLILTLFKTYRNMAILANFTLFRITGLAFLPDFQTFCGQIFLMFQCFLGYYWTVSSCFKLF